MDVSFVTLQMCILQGLNEELGGVLRGPLLACVLVFRLVAVGPVADCLDHDPVHLVLVAGNVKPSPFHFSAHSLGFQRNQLVAIVNVVDQLVAGQNHPRPDSRALPSSVSEPLEMIDESGCRGGFVVAQDDFASGPNPLQVVEAELLRE
jgi:hypothetical protein